jgi:hypothetical protein
MEAQTLVVAVELAPTTLQITKVVTVAQELLLFAIP